ncbi:MAG TPA: 23S rRNA (guanosine(2251)-2'-O)-methyltransferase RlmB [bacterium]
MRAAEGVLFGINAVEAALRARRRTLRGLHVKAGPPSPKLALLRELAAEQQLSVQEQPAAELDVLCLGGHHQGVALRCGPLPLLDDRSALAHGAWQPGTPGTPPLLVALDQVEDPRNLGAVVRSAAAFGAAGLVVPRDHSAPLSAVASSASAGALERFPVHEVANLARFCEQARQQGFWVVGSSAEGDTPLHRYVHDRPLVLVLGNEGRGLRPLVARACDQHLTIPLPGGAAVGGAAVGGGVAGSLNVSAAAAVLLYHLLGRR